jgi:hypothetical protein
MNYRVFWTPQAEARLKQIAESSENPGAIIATAREIDRLLVREANVLGESRYDTVRVYTELPLGIQFDVLEDVHTAIVDVVGSLNAVSNQRFRRLLARRTK